MVSVYLREWSFGQYKPCPADQQCSSMMPEMLAGKVVRMVSKLGYLREDEFQCRCFDGTVQLTGTAPSYYVKAMAQTVAAKVPDVRRVVNQLKVVRNTEPSEDC